MHLMIEISKFQNFEINVNEFPIHVNDNRSRFFVENALCCLFVDKLLCMLLYVLVY